jgi:uncharacterized coiled-coil DUF342 family protein
MTSITRMPSRHPVDLDMLEQEITSTTLDHSKLPTMQMQAEPDIGRLSADAVLEQFKMAAKSVEEMGVEVQERARALDAAMKQCDADLKILAEAAEMIREKGKHAHAEIERASAVSKDIRSIVDQIKSKLAD